MAKWIPSFPQWWETIGDRATADVDCSRWRCCGKSFQNILSHPDLRQMLQQSIFSKLDKSSYDSEFAIISKIILQLCERFERCRYPIVEWNKCAANYQKTEQTQQSRMCCSVQLIPTQEAFFLMLQCKCSISTSPALHVDHVCALFK